LDAAVLWYAQGGYIRDRIHAVTSRSFPVHLFETAMGRKRKSEELLDLEERASKMGMLPMDCWWDGGVENTIETYRETVERVEAMAKDAQKARAAHLGARTERLRLCGETGKRFGVLHEWKVGDLDVPATYHDENHDDDKSKGVRVSGSYSANGVVLQYRTLLVGGGAPTAQFSERGDLQHLFLDTVTEFTALCAGDDASTEGCRELVEVALQVASGDYEADNEHQHAPTKVRPSCPRFKAVLDALAGEFEDYAKLVEFASTAASTALETRRTQLNAMKGVELKALCEGLSIAKTGKKPVLVDRILKHEHGQPGSAWYNSW